MQPLRYSINVSLDGCIDHRAMIPDEEMHQNAADGIARSDAILLGRVTYELMESGWRQPDPRMPAWTQGFAKTINAAKKYVVSSTLKQVDWNGAELVRGDLRSFVEKLKQQPGRGIATGGVMLPKALAEWGLIDEYELVVHPRIVGHGPRLFDGLAKPLDLKLVDRVEFRSGIVALRYRYEA